MDHLRAARIHAYGGDDVLVLKDAPRPTPGPGQVLIRAIATSVNPFDCAAHAGVLSTYFDYSLPLIPGTDGSGTVEKVGPGGTAWAPGDAVYLRAGIPRWWPMRLQAV